MKIVLIILLFIFCFFIGYGLGALIKKLIDNVIAEKRNNTSNKTDLDYWYTHPHYFVCPDGTKINMSEYLTFEEYKHMSRDQQIQYFLDIHNMLSKDKKYKMKEKFNENI